MDCSRVVGTSRGTGERPAVWIFASRPMPEDAVSVILWGLEEEGIPAELSVVSAASAEALAKEAAAGSPLDVGIGVNGADEVAALHHRDLGSGRPLFSVATSASHAMQLRRLGTNAARLVKGNPLVFHEETL